jgi:uncharacterized protein (DUF1786 family)
VSDEITDLVSEKLSRYMADKFTGQITFTFHCRSGGVGNISLEVRQDFGQVKKTVDNGPKKDYYISK